MRETKSKLIPQKEHILKELNKYFLVFGHSPYEFAFRSGYKKHFFYFTSIRNPRDRYLSNYFRNKKDFEKKGEKFENTIMSVAMVVLPLVAGM